MKSDPIGVLELENVDSDIKGIFESIGYANFQRGIPSQIQIIRLMRRLIDELGKCNTRIKNSGNCE